MAARSDGSLIQPRADGRPVAVLSLQDKALLRKYSIPDPSDGLNTTAIARLVQKERDGLMIRSEGSQGSKDVLKVDRTDPKVFDSVAHAPADPLEPILSSVPKGSELPSSGEADPKVRRRIGKVGIKKEPREDGEGASIEVFGSRSTNLGPPEQKNMKSQNADWFQSTQLDTRDCYIVRKCGVTDMVLLYITLVSDRAIPAGFLAEFLSLETFIETFIKTFYESSLTDAEAERLLIMDKKQRDTQILNSSAASDQLVLAAELKPRRYRSKWQRIVYEGPTARKDLENAERSRWVASFGDLLRHTDTPMGRLMRKNPSNIQLLGSGLRAGTLRSRVRSKRKFLEWLSAAHKVAFPVHWQQLLSFFKFDSPNLVFGDLRKKPIDLFCFCRSQPESVRRSQIQRCTMCRERNYSRQRCGGGPREKLRDFHLFALVPLKAT